MQPATILFVCVTLCSLDQAHSVTQWESLDFLACKSVKKYTAKICVSLSALFILDTIKNYIVKIFSVGWNYLRSAKYIFNAFSIEINSNFNSISQVSYTTLWDSLYSELRVTARRHNGSVHGCHMTIN